MDEFLSGYNFARKSDVVFSETILENNSHKTYVVDNFELDNNNIIFCKTDYVLQLFEVLKNEDEIHDIKLITHESDYEITEELFNLKPKCISKWYGLNVNYKNDNLIPIPLGIANDYCKITLKHQNLKRSGTPEKFLYINHRSSTNLAHRSWIYDYFQTSDWCTLDDPNLTLDQYKNQLDNHKFILCPRGNGIDTHRLWESLYHGIIPIVENHIHYSCLADLPVIIVDSFKEINKEFLEQKEYELNQKKFNMEKLNINWWIDFIRSNGL